MFNFVSLLVATALVAQQSSLEANAEIDNVKLLDNSLQPGVVVSPKRRRLRPFVRISSPARESARLVPGTLLELDCEAMGLPAPTIQWLKNGEPFVDYEEEANEILPEEPNSFARLTSKLLVPGSDDGDEYTCVARAGLKQTTATTTVFLDEVDPEKDLSALQKLYSMPSRPRLTLYYNEMFSLIGGNAVLPCRFFSLAKTQVFWQDNEGNMVYGNPRFKVLPSGDLLIPSLRWSDMGQYTCTVKNLFGKDSAATFVYPTQDKKH